MNMIIEDNKAYQMIKRYNYNGFHLAFDEVYTKGIILSKIAHTFDNGITVICNEHQLPEIADKLGLRLNGYYKSNTKGWIKIDSMTKEHRINAARKLIKESKIKNKELILELYESL